MGARVTADRAVVFADYSQVGIDSCRKGHCLLRLRVNNQVSCTEYEYIEH
jgi:hypothetical protein